MVDAGQIGNLDRTPIGFKIYYTDGTEYKSTSTNLGLLIQEFLDQPSDNVIIIDVFQKGQYWTYKTYQKKWVKENYKIPLHTQNYYWVDPVKKTFHKGESTDIPTVIDNIRGAVKIGTIVDDSVWNPTYRKSHDDRVWV